MKRTFWTSLAWVLTNASFVALLFWLETDANFFRWSPNWTLQSTACLSGLLVLIVLVYYLARLTRDKGSLAVSAIACIGLLGIVLVAAPPEPISTGWFSRPSPSPDWYRWGCVAVSSIPLVFWSITLLRVTTHFKIKEKASRTSTTTPPRSIGW